MNKTPPSAIFYPDALRHTWHRPEEGALARPVREKIGATLQKDLVNVPDADLGSHFAELKIA